MTPDHKPKIVDFELLPNEPDPIVRGQAIPRIIALLMDDLFRLPGTKRRFGLNPVLDLIPVVGDASAAVISAMTLFVAVRSGVPKVVTMRMGLNVLLNALIGIIPGVGEAFAFWFRPSHRNYELLKTHMLNANSGVTVSTKGDTAFVFAIVGVVLLLFTACVVSGLFISMLLARMLFGHN